MPRPRNASITVDTPVSILHPAGVRVRRQRLESSPVNQSFPLQLRVALVLFAAWITVASGLSWLLALFGSSEPAAAAIALAVMGSLAAVAVLGSRRAMKPVMALVALALLPLALKWLLRLGFVIQHGGMDCASCQGSPLLFGYYWMIETAILVPGLLLVGWLFLLLLPEPKAWNDEMDARGHARCLDADRDGPDDICD